MSESLRRKSSLPYLIVPFVLIIDQATKVLAAGSVAISCNSGIGLGLNVSASASIVISSVVLLYLLYHVIKGEYRFQVPIFLILGGGLSNLIDRLSVGCVRDFISIGFFPSFNVADSAITLGVLIMIYQLVLIKRSNEKV